MWPSGHGMALVTFSCLLFLPPLLEFLLLVSGIGLLP